MRRGDRKFTTSPNGIFLTQSICLLSSTHFLLSSTHSLLSLTHFPFNILAMPNLYVQDLNGNGEILKQRLKSFASVEDRLDCQDELDLQQSVLQDQAESYAEALETKDPLKKTAWGKILSGGVKDVVATKERMVKMNVLRAESISRETIFVWVKNIAELLYTSFPENEEKITKVVEQIEQSVLGTSQSADVTENDLFKEMMMSVPVLEDMHIENVKES